MKFKKGQGLSLDVIIIAALALIVLVVLIVIFTGKAGQFKDKVGEEAKSELISMQAQYGQCKPTAGKESSFQTSYSNALKIESAEESRTAKEEAKQLFQSEISNCRDAGASKESCTDAGCRWG